MSNVAVIEFSKDILDSAKRSAIISSTKILTITLPLKIQILDDMRPITDPAETFEFRDADLEKDLIGTDVTVKFIKNGKGKERGTIIIEADIATKLPGTGSETAKKEQTEEVR